MIGYVGDIISWNGSRKWNGSLDVGVNGIIVKAKSFCNSSLFFCWWLVVVVGGWSCYYMECFVRSFFDGFLDAASIKYRKCVCVCVYLCGKQVKHKSISKSKIVSLWNIYEISIFYFYIFYFYSKSGSWIICMSWILFLLKIYGMPVAKIIVVYDEKHTKILPNVVALQAQHPKRW